MTELHTPHCETDKTVLQLRRQGRTYQQIADQLGVSRSRIGQRFKRMLDSRPRNTGIINTLSSEQKEQIAALGESGATIAQICTLMALGEHTVRKVIRLSGVTLRSGRRVGPYSDIGGERFGLLTALSPQGKYRSEYRWLCRCDCGGTKIVRITSLRDGSAKSCGCSRRGRSPARVRPVRPTKAGLPRLNDEQIEAATVLWSQGRNTAEIAAILRFPSEAAVANSLAAEREERRKAVAA